MLLTVRRTCPRPGSTTASFVVRAGEIVGIAGLVGAGRTELARALFGAAKLSAGTVALADGTTLGRSPSRSLAGGLALVPESRKDEGLLFGRSSIENTTLSRLAAVRARWASSGAGSSARRPARCSSAATCARRRTARRCRALSGGNQQKVLLARTLLCEPAGADRRRADARRRRRRQAGDLRLPRRVRRRRSRRDPDLVRARGGARPRPPHPRHAARPDRRASSPATR